MLKKLKKMLGKIKEIGDIAKAVNNIYGAILIIIIILSLFVSFISENVGDVILYTIGKLDGNVPIYYLIAFLFISGIILLIIFIFIQKYKISQPPKSGIDLFKNVYISWSWNSSQQYVEILDVRCGYCDSVIVNADSLKNIRYLLCAAGHPVGIDLTKEEIEEKRLQLIAEIQEKETEEERLRQEEFNQFKADVKDGKRTEEELLRWQKQQPGKSKVGYFVNTRAVQYEILKKIEAEFILMKEQERFKRMRESN